MKKLAALVTIAVTLAVTAFSLTPMALYDPADPPLVAPCCCGRSNP